MQDTAESLFGNSETKERINFTLHETERLQCLFAKHRSILLSKKTDGVSNRRKDDAWRSIHIEFNALGDNPRSIKQLKYKFENMKRVAKKAVRKKREEMRGTGEGTPTPPPGNTSDPLRLLVPIHGNTYTLFPCIDIDDDIKNKNPQSPEEEPQLEKVKIEINEDDYTEDMILEPEFPANELILKEELDTSTSNSTFTRPSTPLKRRVRQRNTAEHCNLVRKLSREKNKLEVQKLKDSIRHAQEIHDQAIRHNEERHKLELKKLNLEILLTKKHLND